MDNYNFWADLLTTWRAMNDWIKALSLIVPPAFLLGLIALAMWFRIAPGRLEQAADDQRPGTIHRDDQDRPHK